MSKLENMIQYMALGHIYLTTMTYNYLNLYSDTTKCNIPYPIQVYTE